MWFSWCCVCCWWFLGFVVGCAFYLGVVLRLFWRCYDFFWDWLFKFVYNYCCFCLLICFVFAELFWFGFGLCGFPLWLCGFVLINLLLWLYLGFIWFVVYTDLGLICRVDYALLLIVVCCCSVCCWVGCVYFSC